MRPAFLRLGAFRALGHVLAAFVVVTATPSARADDRTGDPHACAVDFFAAGRKLLDAGDWSTAIPIFKKSLALSPTIGARLNLGDCYVKAAEPWSAYVQYQAAALLADATHDARRAAAEASAAALDAQVLRVHLVMSTAGSAVVGLDGVVVPPAEVALLRDGKFAVDPSRTHLFEVTAEQQKPWRREVSGPAGATSTFEVALEAPPASAAMAPQAPSANASGRRTVGLVVGAVGATGVIVGAVLGAVAVGEASHARALCTANGGSYPGTPRDPVHRRPAVVDSANDAARGEALGSSVALAVGVAALAAGVVLYLTAARVATVTVAPAAGREMTGVRVGLTW